MTDLDAGDNELMAAFNGGDRAALEELFSRYRLRLLGLFRKGGLGEEEAWDATQDTFMKVLLTAEPGSKARPFDPDRGPFKPWVFAVAYHVLQNAWARRGRYVGFDDLQPVQSHGEAQAYERAIPSRDDGSPEEQADWKEQAGRRREVVRECLAALPERERVALDLWMRMDGDMRLKDLARVLNVSVPTAYRVQDRALASLREKLAARGIDR